MAEHSTVNRRVTGSSPVGGAKLKASERSSEAFPFSRRDSNAVTTALGAGAGAPTPNFVWSSPVGGSCFICSSGSSPVGTFSPSHESVTTPPYVSAGVLPSGPRAYAPGEATMLHPAKNVKAKAQRSSSPTSTTRLPNARRGSGASAFSYAYSKANPQGQPTPESYACSSTQPPERRKYLKR